MDSNLQVKSARYQYPKSQWQKEIEILAQPQLEKEEVSITKTPKKQGDKENGHARTIQSFENPKHRRIMERRQKNLRRSLRAGKSDRKQERAWSEAVEAAKFGKQ
jgi:hypothetical protein